MFVMIVMDWSVLTINEVLVSLEVSFKRLTNDPHDCLLAAFFFGDTEVYKQVD